MGITKTEKFTQHHNRIAELTKAIGHPARVAILETIIQRQSCICGELVDDLPLSQSTISQHLSELKKVGLIKGTISGPSTCYCVNEEVWEEAKLVLKQFMDSYSAMNACC